MRTEEKQQVGSVAASNPAKLTLRSRLTSLRKWLNPALPLSLAVTAALVGARQLGWLEPIELAAYDVQVRSRPPLPPDQRLLIVTIDDADINAQKKWPLPDAVFLKLIQNLSQNQAALIGLDNYRDLPVEPGHQAFAKELKQNPRIIPVCKVSDADAPGVPPPPSAPGSRVGFSDLVVDPGGTVRRGLFFLDPSSTDTPSPCRTPFSFSFQLAQQYLKQKYKLEPQLTPQQEVKIGNVLFKRLLSADGGYQHMSSGGYQVLLNYRSADAVAQTITLTEALNGKLTPDLVKDRIVLIGSSAPSLKDTFYTPYSGGLRANQQMPGVVIHAQVLSQILGAVLDGRRLFSFWSEGAEILWIWGWSLAGGVLIVVSKSPRQLFLLAGCGVGSLLGVTWILFLGAVWVPVVAPVLGLVSTWSMALAYTNYRAQQEQLAIAQKLQKQNKDIAELKALLDEASPQDTVIDPQSSPISEVEDSTAIAPTGFDEDSTATAPTDFGDEDSTAIADRGRIPDEALDREKPTFKPNPVHFLARRYHITRILSSGGFGVTFLAEDRQRPGHPICVVKHLKPARQDERFLQIARRLFHSEAEVLERVGSHPQIPQLLAYFEENQEFYLVEEYIKGASLSDELPTDKKQSEKFVIGMLTELLEVLEFIHRHGVIHRDIKPSNIIRSEASGQLVLIDFGAVKEIQPHSTTEENHTVAIGTRGYTPPEQYAGQPGFMSDIYALGMIGIQAITGIFPQQLPVSPTTGNISWRPLAANVREEFAAILDKMVRYHFPDRYQSVTDVLEDLKAL